MYYSILIIKDFEIKNNVAKIKEGIMCFRKKIQPKNIEINSKFKVGDFVDFWHRDDVYFGSVSDVYLGNGNNIFYDIDIAGQCPTTFTKIPEEKVIRIHRD